VVRREHSSQKSILSNISERSYGLGRTCNLTSTDNIVKVAKEKVEEILRTHTPTPLERDVRRKIERILQQCKQELT
jgi:hypothetical protein